MTVVQLKKMAASGKFALITKEFMGKTGSSIPELYQGHLIFTGYNSNSLLFENERKETGFIKIESAKLVEYGGSYLTVYLPAYREPTGSELVLLEAWKRIESQLLANNKYYNVAPDKREFFESSGYPYMSGFTYKKRCYNERLDTVFDCFVKGEVQFKFDVVELYGLIER